MNDKVNNQNPIVVIKRTFRLLCLSISWLALLNSADARTTESYLDEAVRTPQQAPPGFAELERSPGGQLHAVNDGTLRFVYREQYHDLDGLLAFTIKDGMNTVVIPHLSLPPNLQLSNQYGFQLFELDVDDCMFTSTGALPDGTYLLEVRNEKDEVWYLRFQRNNAPACP